MIDRNDLRALLRLGAPLVLPWWLIIPVVTWWMYDLRQSAETVRQEQRSAERMIIATQTLQDSIAQLRRDAGLLTRVTVSQLDTPTREAGRAVLAAVMRDFMEAHPRYAQARFLSTNCVEQIRYDRRGTDIVRTPDDALQDKSDRYYCAETLQLAREETYLSPLDLNIEQGRVVQPIEPTLRIGRRVYARDGSTLGLIVLNFNASRILETFSLGGSGALALLNSDGYFLASPRGDNVFGFNLGHPEWRLAESQPDLWRAMTTEGQGAGRYTGEDGQWLFQRVESGNVLGRVSGPEWYMASNLQSAANVTEQRELLWTHLALAAVALLVVSTMAMLLALRNLREARTARQLANTNAHLEASLSRLESSLEERVKSEKLASLGLLVAGVAHELNTPLGGAMLTCRQLEEEARRLKTAYDEGLRESDVTRHLTQNEDGLKLLRRNLDRAGKLIARFKAVASDRATAERSLFKLNSLLDDILALIHVETKHSPVRIALDVPDDLELDSFPGPLGQIVQNLLQNAVRHGFESGTPGTVVVSAAVKDGLLDLSITDNGRGIPEADRARIWDPFFTTARHEGGTGLGLHLCQQLAENVLGGRLLLGNDPPGGGTCMRLMIPQVAPDTIRSAHAAG